MEQAKKERKRIGKMNEIAWVLGIVLCALGVALCTKADFGLSMIAAPAYIIHVGMSRFFFLVYSGDIGIYIPGNSAFGSLPDNS